jgi:3-phytase
MTSIRPALLSLAIVLALGACTSAEQAAPESADASAGAAATAAPERDREPDELDEDPMLADADLAHSVVKEAFVSAATPDDNVDSPASWTAPDGKVWLLATAKEGKGLVVYDGETGETLRTVGSDGPAAGQFDRPNGIFVHQDLVFVVERDNRRVQVLTLPDFESIASFGQDELQAPYGMWLREHTSGELEVLVTDAYMAGEDAEGEDIVPPLVELDRRVQRYLINRDGNTLEVRHAGSIGDTTAAGAIQIPESIWGDPAHDRLLIAEEDAATGTALREYTLGGEFRGRSIGLGDFGAQAEGIALFACDDGSGYWIATDQFKDRSLFHVFDRVSMERIGAFAGEAVANTDGVWLHQAPTPRFPNGVFYAVHDDMAVAAFDWTDIAAALDLKQTCPTP